MSDPCHKTLTGLTLMDVDEVSRSAAAEAGGGGGSRPPPLIPHRKPPAARKRSREELDGDALLAAASRNDEPTIRELVGKRGVPVDWCQKGGGGQTALHLAAFAANVEAVQALLELGASINLPNDISGATPLHLAAMGKGTRPRKQEAIATLVAGGADCFQEDSYGSQPWHYAHDEEARLLMRGPEFKLHFAVLNKDVGALSELLRQLESPGHVNELGPDGNTPLHVAACVRCPEAARMLLTAGADPNEHNEHGATPLHTAVSVLAEEVADVLIAAGARLDAKSILVYEYNSRGINWVGPGDGTPLNSPKGSAAAVAGGAPGSAGSSGAGPSPRNRREYRRRESTSSSEGEGSGSGDERPFEDKTPLHLAVTTRNGLGMARFLLDKGADPNAFDAKGRTCLHVALERLLEVSPMGIPAETEACLALLSLLLEKGADPLQPYPGRGHGSCAHWCVQHGHVDALELLLARTFGPMRQRLLNGPDAAAEGGGLTPLMLSARDNKVGCLETLLRNGAEGSEEARGLAERHGHTAAVCIIDTFSSFAGVA